MRKLTPVLEGDGVRLRLAGMEDAGFLFELRSDPKLTKYIPPLTDFAAHRSWLERNLPRPDDYLFIAEEQSSGAAKGVISIHDINFATQEGFIGRWIMTPGSGCGFEAIRLAYEFAFDMLGLGRLWAEVLVKNIPVMAFHMAVGLKKGAILHEPWILRGEPYEVQNLYADKAIWQDLNKKIKQFHNIIIKSE